MAGTIIVSNLKTDTDNSFIVRSNTGATLFSCNTSGLDVANTIPAGSITASKLAVGAALPSQTGNGTYYLTSDGTNALWKAQTALTIANTQLTGTLTASQIASINATTATSGTLPKARLPAGSVLQVVTATTGSNFATSSTSYVDVTGMSASITPTSATSKILVIFAPHLYVSRALNESNAGQLKILRDATTIYENDRGIYGRMGVNATSDWKFDAPCNITYLDSPSTTSSITYKLQMRVQTASNSGECGINDYSSAIPTNGSNIILMEIAV